MEKQAPKRRVKKTAENQIQAMPEESPKYANRMTERRKFWDVKPSQKGGGGTFLEQSIEDKAKITAISKFK